MSRDFKSVGKSQASVIGDAVDEFTELLNAGRHLDADEFLNRYPDCAPTLRPILATLVAMRQETSGGSDAGENVPEGTKLGDFRILREIGRGGMGIVYDAEQLSLKRRVALKILPFAALLEGRQLKRFRTEARAAAMLKHPNIVSVYSIGCERGVNYFAMERIDGPSLAEVLTIPERFGTHTSPTQSNAREGGKSMAVERADTEPIAALSTHRSSDTTAYHHQVARLGIQVAEALQYAHTEGVIHRDIKPANLLLDETGTPHIADFGLAQVQSGADLTMTGDLVGTLRYMSPEQIAGDHLVDQRTDVYSLGLTLYEVIVRRPAFDQTSRPELIKAISESDPPALTRIDPFVPADLATIVHKAIAMAPEDRYQQMIELADDLRRFLEHRTILAKRSTHIERFRRLIRRNRLIASLTAIVLALLLGISVISSVAALRYAANAKQQSIAGRRQSLRLYAREMRLAHLAIEDRQIVHAEELLLKWVPDSGEEDFRGFEWYHLWARCYLSLAPWTISHDSYIFDVAFSSDGRFLADGSMYAFIDVWDTSQRTNERPIRKIDLPVNGIVKLETTFDGSYLIGGGQSGFVGIWDWRNYELVDSLQVQTEHPRNMIFTITMNRENDLIALVAYHGNAGSSIIIWDREQDRQHVVATRSGRAWAAFDANDHLLVAAKGARRIDTIDAHSGEILNSHALDGEWNAAAMLRDRNSIAIGLSRRHGDIVESQLEVRRLDNWQLTLSASLGEAVASDVCTSHDGQEIAVGDENGQVLQISMDGQRKQRRSIHNDPVMSLTYSPDGRHLASTERSRYAYVFPREPSTDTSSMVTRCETPSKVTSGIGFVDEGRTVCTNEGGHLVRFWDAHTGKQREESLQLEKGPWNLIRIQTDPSRGRLAIVQTNWPFDVTVDEKGMRTNVIPARVTIWDDQRRTVIGDPIQMDTEVFNHLFSFDGKYLAVCGLQSIRLIDIETGKESERQFHSEGWLYACAFSSDAQRLYYGMLSGETHVIDMATWMTDGVPLLTDSRRLQSISCSPDGRYLGSCGFDRCLKIFDESSRELLRESDKVPMYQSYVRFSSDGERAAVGSPEGVVRIYATESAEEVLSIDVPNYYSTCEFSQDGNSIAIASGVDAMIVHAPNRKAIAGLSKKELRGIIRQNSRMYQVQ